LLVVLASCDDAPPPEPMRPPPRPSAIARAPAADAAVAEPSVDPPAPVGDLLAELERFTTVDACVKERASLDPLVGDALAAIGYDTLLGDACRMFDAAKARDPRRCEAIEASPLRERCASLVAIIARDADQCPWEVPSRPALGREPVCLAVVTRDERTCAAAIGMRRPVCEALVTLDAKRCDAQALESERAACKRELGRFSPVLATGRGEKAASATRARGVVQVTPMEGTPAVSPSEVDVSGELAPGVVLVEQRDALRFEVGRITPPAVSRFGAPPLARPQIALIAFAPKPGKVIKLERCELSLPGRRAIVSDPCTLAVRTQKLDGVRGGEVTLSLDGVLEDRVMSHAYKVHYELTTFVRDVLRTSALASALVGLPMRGVADAAATGDR
jgi:hypothetical protein